MGVLYFDCATGISGDMVVASLLDLGADEQVLRKVLSGIGEDGFQIRISRVEKAGIDCCDFDVVLDAAHENHDHDMDYLYGHMHAHTPVPDGAQGSVQDQEPGQLQGKESGQVYGRTHAHRTLADIAALLQRLDMTERARETALSTFRILAQAEAKVHGVPVDKVHFHEVGAVDSIVDVVAAAVCLDNLKVDQVAIPYLCEGTGTVRTQHGILPVPVPAVLQIAAAHRLPLAVRAMEGERITPTGAAFAAAVMTSSKLPEVFRVLRVGIGAGKRKYGQPSMLRAILLETEMVQGDTVWKLECNIDDSTGEQLGFAMERLFAAGALEVFYQPAYMKKNRPAWLLSVLTEEADIKKMESVIFRETTTIGIRKQRMCRSVLKRRVEEVQTPYGRVKVKVCVLEGEEKPYPEYESVRTAALHTNQTFDTVFHAAAAAYKAYRDTDGTRVLT